MDILSEISSVSTHDSMPHLIDPFGRIVDDDQTTVTLDSYEQEPLNKHWYFDEDGNEVDYETWSRLREEEEETDEEDDTPWIRTPRINQHFILKHPRVILAFLRFIDSYNELADPEEVLMLHAIPQRLVNRIKNHSSVTDAPAEFQDEVEELLYRLDRHSDLSELHWG